MKEVERSFVKSNQSKREGEKNLQGNRRASMKDEIGAGTSDILVRPTMQGVQQKRLGEERKGGTPKEKNPRDIQTAQDQTHEKDKEGVKHKKSKSRG